MKLKKVILSAVAISLVLGGCSSNVEKSGFTGVTTYETLYDPTGQKGDVVVTTIKFEKGTPTEVSIDTRQENGNMKKKESEAGNYVMKQGEEKAWHEQITLLEKYLVENKCDVSKIKLADNGGTDAVSGVSIKVDAYLKNINEIMTSVNEGTTLKEGFTGVKETSIPYDDTGKKSDQVIAKVVFDHDVPVSVKIDVKLEDGTMKSKLSEDGKYVMKENEEKAWHEQIAELEQFIVKNDFDLSKITLNDAGNTDAVSGVSIKINKYIEAVEAALKLVK